MPASNCASSAVEERRADPDQVGDERCVVAAQQERRQREAGKPERRRVGRPGVGLHDGYGGSGRNCHVRLLSPAPSVGGRMFGDLRSAEFCPLRQPELQVLWYEIVWKSRQVLGAVLGDEHEILEPDAAEARPVAARLDRDHVAAPRAARCRRKARARLLVHLEPDAVAERVEEAVLERLARRPSCAGSDSRRPRRSRTCRRRSRCRSTPALDLARSRGRAPPCRGGAIRRPRRARRRRRTSASCRRSMTDSLSRGQMSIDDRLAGADLARAHVVADRAPAGPCETMNSSAVGAVRDERLRRSRPSRARPSAARRRARAPSPFGVARRSRSRAAAIPASAARWARRMPASSASVFTRRRSSKNVAVGGQLDALGAQPVGEPERERRRARRRSSTPRLLTARTAISSRISPVREPAAISSSDAELLERVQLVAGRAPRAAAISIEPTRRADAVPLDVEERIGDAERHLVAQLGRADRVGVDQDVGHAPDSN